MVHIPGAYPTGVQHEAIINNNIRPVALKGYG